MTDAPRVLSVASGEEGRRLDLFLAEKLALSRAQARRLLGRGAVKVDDRPVGSGDKGRALAAGARVEVAPFRRREEECAREAPGLVLATLAAGPGWIAVDKPAGVPVHPLREDETGTALGALRACHPEVQGVGEGGLRSGVVHRLDVETSGVLLFALEESAWQRLRAAFREHRVEKVYRALVAGRVDAAGGAEVGLVLARHRPARVRVLSEEERRRSRGARVCVMSWRPLEHFAAATLLEVRPVTGFLHQIRAVLAQRGHPLLGDRTYAPAEVAAAAPRHMLHAAALRFEEVAAESPEPEDFRRCCAGLRGAA